MPYKDRETQLEYIRAHNVKVRGLPQKFVRVKAFNQAHPNWEQDFVKLSHQQQQILKKFYGLDSGEPSSLQAIADIYGCSREYIRKLRDAALVKIGYKSNA
jgi:DNA-directed RNA polymerase sigma subunit (sigma70/sigma32)